MGCVEPFKECVAERSARIDAYLADPVNAGKGNRVLAEELGVSEKAIRNHKRTNADVSANDTDPEGYLPQPMAKSERVVACWGIWEQMDGNERTALITMIAQFMNKEKVA